MWTFIRSINGPRVFKSATEIALGNAGLGQELTTPDHRWMDRIPRLRVRTISSLGSRKTMLLTLRRIRFDWQILPLLLAAIWGLVAAYNTRLALVQFGFILLGIVLYFLVANLPDPVRVGGQSRSVLAGLLAVVPLALSLYFLLTNDWPRSTGKLHVLNPVLEVLAASPLKIDWAKPQPQFHWQRYRHPPAASGVCSEARAAVGV